jgi:ubiquinone/menaquinone biosynthesis C-methylase UbiE
MDTTDTAIYEAEYRTEYEVHRRNLAAQNRFYRNRCRNILKLLQPRAHELVLDLGCGIGTVSFLLAARNCRVVGLDVSVMALSMAQKIAREQNGARPWFVVGSITALPFKPGIIDKIIAADLTEHLTQPDFEAMLLESGKVLKAGGQCGIYTPSPTHIFEILKDRDLLIRKDHSHIGLRTMGAVVAGLRKYGFVIDRMFHAPTHIPGFSLIEKTLMWLPCVGGFFRRRVCVLAKK